MDSIKHLRGITLAFDNVSKNLSAERMISHTFCNKCSFLILKEENLYHCGIYRLTSLVTMNATILDKMLLCELQECMKESFRDCTRLVSDL